MHNLLDDIKNNNIFLLNSSISLILIFQNFIYYDICFYYYLNGECKGFANRDLTISYARSTSVAYC